MGTDVYGTFHKKECGKWIFVEKYYYSERGYLRSWLAPWERSIGLHTDIEPIAPFRGLPPDGPYENVVHFSNTVSWLTADEILDSLPVILKCTIRLPYDAFLNQREKEYWDSTYIDDPDGFYKEHRFITAKWRPYEDGYTFDGWGVDLFFDISEDTGIKAFTDKVQELKTRHGEVRYVFRYN